MAKWIELNNSITIRCDAIYALEKKHSFGQYYICIAVANQNTPYEFCFGENKVACEHKYNELKRDLFSDSIDSLPVTPVPIKKEA